uniref:Nose resistant-to-fluoxetine protein N-terminal domain-containing protein n=1 Tax=Astatotilapia calliptera TaxID=8154 RepID=A0A3P8NQH5_ASTCA
MAFFLLLCVLSVYDAFGKVGSNVVGGNTNQPGLLQQCRSAHGPSFSGQYCQVFLRQGRVQYFVGICVPDSCEKDDVQTLVLYDSNHPTQTCALQSRVYGCLQAISIQKTTQGIFSTSTSIPVGGYASLNGIRVLSLLWIICGHSAQFPVINSLGMAWTCFHGCRYLLTAGVRLEQFQIDSAEDKLSLSLVGSYLLKRITRIQPLHLFIMCLTIGLISLVKWGPYWFPFIDTVMDCKTYWWANLLLISNLLPVHEICIPWTWYLSLDFQCYATTPLLVYLYRLTSENYVLYYYVKPYTRYGPFLIGILTGIYLTWQAALGWLCCLSLLALLVGLPYILKETPANPSVPHALYQGLHRPLWALAVTWIILACEEGYGGFIKRFLSLTFWVPLSKISFACYLIHPVFIILYIGFQETPIHYTDINFMYLFLGHLVLTLAVSYMLTVLVEKPYLLPK